MPDFDFPVARLLLTDIRIYWGKWQGTEVVRRQNHIQTLGEQSTDCNNETTKKMFGQKSPGQLEIHLPP